MSELSDKIAALAEDDIEKRPALSRVIEKRLPDFVAECMDSLKSPLERGIAKVKAMDAADRPLNR